MCEADKEEEALAGLEGAAAVLIVFGMALGALLLRIVAYVAGWWP